jgi:glycine/serine hydroxymethyltransferase
MTESAMREIGAIISQVISTPDDESSIQDAKEKALALCDKFSLPY